MPGEAQPQQDRRHARIKAESGDAGTQKQSLSRLQSLPNFRRSFISETATHEGLPRPSGVLKRG